MKHRKWWCRVFFNVKCPKCWIFRFRYGYRLDPVGYMKDRDTVYNNPAFSPSERLWILKTIKPIEIEYD